MSEENLKLPHNAQEIYDALRDANGDWLSRTELAERLNKKSLNHGDLAYLEVLSVNGLIDSQREESENRQWHWVYRANSDSIE